MALLKARLKDLILQDRESGILTKACTASDASITVDDNSGMAVSDLMFLGQLGSEATETLKVTSVTGGTLLGFGGTPTAYNTGAVFNHPPGTPFYRVDYDQVEFYRAASLTGSKTLLATVTIQPDDLYARYDDTSNTTGYAFFRFKNSITSAVSTYSDGVSYGGYADLSLYTIRTRVRRYMTDKDGKPITFFSDGELNDAINDAIRDIAAELRLPNFQTQYSFSTVANQINYDLGSWTDADGNPAYWGSVYDLTWQTQPLVKIDEKTYNDLNWNANSTGTPYNYFIRGKNILMWPTAGSAAQTTQLNGAIGATDTSITVDSTSGFAPKGRFIIDSEVISYSTATSTAFTGCTRGIEGTTAAAHLDDATVTNRDIIVTFFQRPQKLAQETDISQIEDPDLVAVVASQSLAFTRMPDDKGLMDRFTSRRVEKMKLYMNMFGTQYADNFGRAKRKQEVLRNTLYWPALNNPPNVS